MPTNEDGEFELVLGNKQLLSVFFIVIILLGVFFTMGYLVGRNSGPADLATKRPPADSNAARTDSVSAMPVQKPQPATETAKPEETPKPEQPAATTPAPVETKPAETKPTPVAA